MLGAAANRPAQILLIGGCLLAGALSVDLVVQAFRDGAPFVIAVFGSFIFAFVAVTRGSVPVAARALATGGIAGVTAALIPALVLMLRPPVPHSSGWAVLVVAAAGVAAAALAPRRRGLRGLNAIVAGLLAGTLAALLIGPLVTAMARFGPESWIPRMATHALTPAARLAERRHLAGEPYLVVLLLGAVLALILGVVALRMRKRVRTAPPLPPTDGRRLIELDDVRPQPLADRVIGRLPPD